MGTSAQPWFLQIDKEIPAKITRHLQNLYLGTNNHDAAITALKGQLDALSATASKTTTIIQQVSNSSTSTSFPGLGKVNNQTGNTSYTVQTQDNGIMLIVDDSSPVSVSLNSAVSAPYFFFITNFGAGTATLTPTTGTINGSASFALPQNYFSVIEYDGTNWWASVLLVLPQNTPAIAHEWLDSYDSSTGAFTQTQPNANDVSIPTVSVSSTYTALTTDYWIRCTSGTFTVTLPDASTVATGKAYEVTNEGTGMVTLTGTGGQLINGETTQTLGTQYSLTVRSTSTGWDIV